VPELSAPARGLMYAVRELPRPPDNPSHLREWTMAEFNRFAGRYLAIERHELSNRIQASS
jgi:hypothetical protein